MRITDKQRLDWLYDYWAINRNGTFTLYFIGSYGNLRKAIDAAIRAERKNRKNGNS